MLCSIKRVLLLLVLTLAAVCAQEDKYYKTLGVERDATNNQIKKAFRKLSLKYHPDKNKGDETAKSKFEELTVAYEVLGDEEKRQLYDLGGEEGLKQQNAPASPFDMFFGGGQGGGGRQRGPDFKMEIQVSLEEIYNGAEKEYTVNRRVLCNKCRGTGAKDGATKKCKECKGSGVVTRMQQLGPGFNVQMQQHCDKCGGKGKTFKTACPHCKGEKLVHEDKLLEAVIEKGMANGAEIVFERASEQSPETVPGNVVLLLKTDAHGTYTRQGHNLHHTMILSLKESLLGFQRTLTQLDGREIPVERKGVTPYDHVMKIKNEGMPHHGYPSDKGEMHVRFQVKFPDSFTPAEQQVLENLLL